MRFSLWKRVYKATIHDVAYGACPGFVNAEFDATLACGRPEYCIVPLSCASYAHDEAVAFS
jgi:hypothetical protein